MDLVFFDSLVKLLEAEEALKMSKWSKQKQLMARDCYSSVLKGIISFSPIMIVVFLCHGWYLLGNAGRASSYSLSILLLHSFVFPPGGLQRWSQSLGKNGDDIRYDKFPHSINFQRWLEASQYVHTWLGDTTWNCTVITGGGRTYTDNIFVCTTRINRDCTNDALLC